MNRTESEVRAKKILLGVTGGIAAYKSADLCRKLLAAGFDVRVVMTKGAESFITPLTFQALTHHPVYTNCFDEELESGMGHIELARWADLIVIAPASANCIAQLAYGLSPDLLTTLCLATKAPLFVVPAMNQQMWLHPATQNNIQILKNRSVFILGPGVGDQACGEFGPGRMLEVEQIIAELQNHFTPASKLPFAHSKNTKLQGLKILITAGPTREAIDAVRFISNYSSGKMGFALAKEATLLGAKVTLISGPVTLPTPEGVTRIDVESADEMKARVLENIGDTDIFIGNAAVSDFKAKQVANIKLKKNEMFEANQSQNGLTLELTQTSDIISAVTQEKSRSFSKKPFCVGFALEKQNAEDYARKKLLNKKLDMIALNVLGKPNVGFNTDTNALTVLWQNGEQFLPLATKQEIAQQLLILIGEHYA